MATAVAPRADNRVKEFLFVWEGVDRANKPMRGETRGPSETVVSSNLRRQGIRPCSEPELPGAGFFGVPSYAVLYVVPIEAQLLSISHSAEHDVGVRMFGVEMRDRRPL